MSSDTSTRLDTVFLLLSDTERRRLLYYLREHGTATRTELADVLTGWLATDRKNGAATAKHRQRLGTKLHHHHIPALRDGGLVTVSSEGDVVEATDWPRWIDSYLDLAFDVEATDRSDLDHPSHRSANDQD